MKKVKEGESFLVKSADYDINFIKPCVSDRKKFLAEVKLKRKFAPKTLCEILEKSRLAKYTKCSEDLGIARISLGQKNIIIFASGEISIRKANDKKDAIDTANFIKSVLLG